MIAVAIEIVYTDGREIIGGYRVADDKTQTAGADLTVVVKCGA